MNPRNHERRYREQKFDARFLPRVGPAKQSVETCPSCGSQMLRARQGHRSIVLCCSCGSKEDRA
jgi:hypothetical protein